MIMVIVLALPPPAVGVSAATSITGMEGNMIIIGTQQVGDPCQPIRTVNISTDEMGKAQPGAEGAPEAIHICKSAIVGYRSSYNLVIKFLSKADMYLITAFIRCCYILSIN